MNIKNVSVDALKPYEKNTKNHSQTQIDNVAESIRQFGIVQPIVIDKNNVIVIGHCRILACKKLGIKQVPCVRVDDLTEEQVRALRIVDNKTNESEWDMDLLAGELQEIDLSNFDFDFGIDDCEGNEPIEDEAPEVDEENEPTAKLGDVYQLGRHRLMCGDSTKAQDVEKLMGGEKADLLITDPPYNVDYEGTAGKIKNDKMADASFREFLTDAFRQADSALKPGGVFYIWHADSEGYNFRSACQDVGWKVRECLIWVKNSLVMGRQDCQWKHEPCLYGWKEGAPHLWVADRKQTTILEFDRPQRSDIHPTMKPVKLFDYQIKNNTRKNDRVLDLFAGSGTTLMACEQSSRNSYNMELDPHYVDAIIKRWENFTGEKAIKVGGK